MTKRIEGAETKLERFVQKWINARATDYPDTGAAGVLEDLMYGGCASGMVGELVYTRDSVAFFKRNADEINALLRSHMDDIGEHDPASIFGDKWDASDPLAFDDSNRNLLAWFAFEETARALGERNGFEC